MTEIHSSEVAYKIHRKNLCRSLLLIKLQASSLKETPAQTFSCRLLQILTEHIFTKQLWTTASVDSIHTVLRIKIQIVFIGLNWIFKVNSWKSVFFLLLFFSFFFLLYLRKESYMNIEALENFISLQCTSSNSGKATRLVLFFLTYNWREAL